MLVPNVTLDGFLRASDVVAPGVWAVEGALLVASLMKLSQLAVGEVSTTYLAVQLVALQMNVVAPGFRKNVPVVGNLIVQFWTDSRLFFKCCHSKTNCDLDMKPKPYETNFSEKGRSSLISLTKLKLSKFE